MNIVGQRKLIKSIDRLIDTNNFSRYSIIQGAFGSGKKVISAYIAKKLNAMFIPCNISVDSVRDVIALSYELTEPTVYMWADADKMSINAKNAVLKVTEEPPQNAYFIMTTTNTNRLLSTLISRGRVFNIQPYSHEDLKEYILNKYDNISNNTLSIVSNISQTPYDVQTLMSTDINKMNNIVNVLCDGIGINSLANELKVATFLKVKDDETEKFDAILFMRACMFRYMEMMINSSEDVLIYSKLIELTSSYISEMLSKSLNKVATLDNWIIDMHQTAVAERHEI